MSKVCLTEKSSTAITVKQLKLNEGFRTPSDSQKYQVMAITMSARCFMKTNIKAYWH